MPITISPHLQQHVSGFDSSICRHGTALHDGADVDPSVAPLITLSHDADAQEVILLYKRRERKVRVWVEKLFRSQLFNPEGVSARGDIYS